MASKGSTAPYPSAARFSDSQCFPQYTASLKCLEEYNSDKSKCQEHFDVYKECKKKETSLRMFTGKLQIFLGSLTITGKNSFHLSQREARLERNKNRSLFS